MKHKILGIIIFSIAMAALEGAVVVYLRALYYPVGFTVTFKIIDAHIVAVELVREIATIVMIAAIAYLTGNTSPQRIAYFLLCFAVWDIFYYVWLKIFINWPLSIFEWDILFLIPITWLGPVLAPVVCSITMILLALAILKYRNVSAFSKIMIALGCAAILFTFMYDYGALLINNNLVYKFPSLLNNKQFISLASTYSPSFYNWEIFWFGEALISTGIWHIHRPLFSSSVTNLPL